MMQLRYLGELVSDQSRSVLSERKSKHGGRIQQLWSCFEKHQGGGGVKVWTEEKGPHERREGKRATYLRERGPGHVSLGQARRQKERSV